MLQLTQSPRRQYGFACLMVLVALLLKLLFNPLLAPQIEPESLLLLFFGAVVMSAYYCGWKSGVLATTLATLVSSCFLMYSTNVFWKQSLIDHLHLGMFVLQGGFISVLMGALHTAKYSAEVNTARLRESEELFHQLTENIREVFWIFSPEKNKVLYVSPAYEEIWGQTTTDLYKQPLAFLEAIHPEDRERVIAARAKEVQGDYDEQYRVIRPDGSMRWVRSRAFPARDSSGKIYQLVGISEDITERQQVEEALRTSERRARQMIESNIIGVMFADIQGKILEVNEAFLQILGYSREELLSGAVNWRELTPPDLRHLDLWAIEQVKQTGKHPPFEKEYFHKDGSRVPVLIGTAYLGGPEELGVGFLLDLSERKQAEEERKRLAAQVQEQARLLEGILSASLDHIYLHDRDGRYLYASLSGTRALGLQPSDVVGKTWRELGLPSQLMEPLDTQRQSVFETGQPITDEVSVPTLEGIRHYEYILSPVHCEDGSVEAVVSTARDITDRKQVREQLQKSEERFTGLVENVPGVIYQYRQYPNDTKDEFTYVSPGCRDILEYEPQTVEQNAELMWALIHPDDLNSFKQSFDIAAPTGEQWRWEWRIITPSGALKWLQGAAKASRQSDCSLLWDGFLLDITERKRAEAEQQKLASIVENSSDFIGIATPRYQVMYVNDAGRKLVGLDNLEAVGQTGIVDFFLPEDHVYVQEQILPALINQGQWIGELRLRHFKTGKPVSVSSNVFSIKDQATGQLIAVATVTHDITERKQAEKEREQLLAREQEARRQAEAASRTKDEFLAIVSHELRSPLNAILGWARLIRTRKLDEAKTNKAIEVIERNAQLQNQLIEDILDISRIIRGKVRLYARPINLVQVVEAALDTVRPTADTKMIQLESRLDSAVGTISGDPDRLQQVVWNLLSNAVKFTPQGGRVEVQLERVDAYAQIKVTDSGKGISLEFLPHIFDRFRQADSTTSRAYGGLGLGLAIVRNLVELHGGMIQVESSGEGQGATFIVQLPLMNDSSGESDLTQLTNREQVPLESYLKLDGLQVLIVDDEVDTREFLVTALEQYGAKVTAAASVDEVQRLLSQFKPDVLLSDIGMPGEDGYALIRWLRGLSPEQGGQIPVAALTAYAREEDRVKALSAGFQMHVPKPIDPTQLIAVVANLAGRG